jgi:hypothetical protein
MNGFRAHLIEAFQILQSDDCVCVLTVQNAAFSIFLRQAGNISPGPEACLRELLRLGPALAGFLEQVGVRNV